MGFYWSRENKSSISDRREVVQQYIGEFFRSRHCCTNKTREMHVFLLLCAQKKHSIRACVLTTTMAGHAAELVTKRRLLYKVPDYTARPG